MARFRLRFLLQEFDLVGTEVILGRSPDCHITIEDPLISRHHASIRITADDARVSDLGSRNGVRVNGRRIEREMPLKDGDRIRLGTQELVFAVVHKKERPPRPTGFMAVCRACGTPYPEGALTCPHCGAPAAGDEDTISGLMVEPRRSWTFQLLGEVIERALSQGRAAEADRIMRRAAKEVDERLAGGDRLDGAHVTMIAGFAFRLAKLTGGSEWVAWALTLHRRHGLVMAGDLVDRLAELDTDAFPDLLRLVDAHLKWYKSRGGETASPADASALARLEQLMTVRPGA